jgi:hypothetical protein
MRSSDFPKLIRGRQTGEAGVNAVSTVVNDKLNWIFRRVNLEHDFGIDGYIDIVREDGSVTGQSIAVQIKSGKTYFKEKTPIGFVFRGEEKHLNYYMNLPVPVLMILHDDVTHQSYWGQFDVRRTEPTPGGWKFNISKNNLLSEKSKPELLDIVGPAVEHTDSIKEHWTINETMNEFDFVLYAIDRDDIESGNTDHIGSFIERIYLNDSLCRKFQGRIEVSISGYDDDPRELWEIPEVVRWYEKADPVIKNWFFFSNTKPPASGLRVYWSCMCHGKRLSVNKKSPHKIKVELDKKRLLELLNSNWLRLNETTDRLGMSIDENKRISFAVCDALELPRGE